MFRRLFNRWLRRRHQQQTYPDESTTLDISTSWAQLEPLRKQRGSWVVIWCICQVMEKHGFPVRVSRRSARSRSTQVFDFRLIGCGLKYNQDDLDRRLVDLLSRLVGTDVHDAVFSDNFGVVADFAELAPDPRPYPDFIAQVERAMRTDLDRGALDRSTPPGSSPTQETQGEATSRRL